MAYYSKRNVKNLDSEWSERNCNIRTRLIYASSHCRGQISASAMTVLSGEQMATLARRRKEGDTLLDTLKGWPDGAGFSHYKVREWLIRSVLTDNKPKWLTSSCSHESKQNSVAGWNAWDKLDKETLKHTRFKCICMSGCSKGPHPYSFSGSVWCNSPGQ